MPPNLFLKPDYTIYKINHDKEIKELNEKVTKPKYL